METPNLYDKLYKAVSEGNRDSIFKWLAKVKSQEMRDCITSLIFDDHTTYSLAKSTLKAVKLEYVVRKFFENLKNAHRHMFVSFSSKGYEHSLEQSLSVTSPFYAELKGRLYCALMHLCGVAQRKNATFILVGLYSTKNKLSVTLNTDVPFQHSIDKADDLSVCMALNHIRQMGGKLNAGRTGLNLKMFRLTLNLDLDCIGVQKNHHNE